MKQTWVMMYWEIWQIVDDPRPQTIRTMQRTQPGKKFKSQDSHLIFQYAKKNRNTRTHVKFYRKKRACLGTHQPSPISRDPELPPAQCIDAAEIQDFKN